MHCHSARSVPSSSHPPTIAHPYRPNDRSPLRRRPTRAAPSSAGRAPGDLGWSWRRSITLNSRRLYSGLYCSIQTSFNVSNKLFIIFSRKHYADAVAHLPSQSELLSLETLPTNHRQPPRSGPTHTKSPCSLQAACPQHCPSYSGANGSQQPAAGAESSHPCHNPVLRSLSTAPSICCNVLTSADGPPSPLPRTDGRGGSKMEASRSNVLCLTVPWSRDRCRWPCREDQSCRSVGNNRRHTLSVLQYDGCLLTSQKWINQYW